MSATGSLFPTTISDEQAWQLFSTTYIDAKTRFLQAAVKVEAAASSLASKGYRSELIVLPLPGGVLGPHGETLSIDALVLERRSSPSSSAPNAPHNLPERIVVHTSGVHGVEGYAGSAVQTAFLTAAARMLSTVKGQSLLPVGSKLIIVHAVNPSGMAWRRRFTAGGNVDLNRNCLSDIEFRHIAAKGGRVHPLFLQMRSLHSPTSRVGLSMPIPVPTCMVGRGNSSSMRGLLVPSGGGDVPAGVPVTVDSTSTSTSRDSVLHTHLQDRAVCPAEMKDQGGDPCASTGPLTLAEREVAILEAVRGDSADQEVAAVCGSCLGSSSSSSSSSVLRWATVGMDYGYWPMAGYCLARYGEPTLRCMIAQGQYVYPDCMYFGGMRTMEQEPALLLGMLREQGIGPENRHLRQMLHIDLHTGLGPRGQSTIMCGYDLQTAMAALLAGVDVEDDCKRPAEERSVQVTYPGQPDLHDDAASEAVLQPQGLEAVRASERASTSGMSDNMAYQMIGGLPRAVIRLAMAGEAFNQREEGEMRGVHYDGPVSSEDMDMSVRAKAPPSSSPSSSYSAGAQHVRRKAVLPPPLTVLEAIMQGGEAMATELGLLPQGTGGDEVSPGHRPMPMNRADRQHRVRRDAEVLALTQEFGTIAGARVVQALRAELGLWNQAQRAVGGGEDGAPFVIGRSVSADLAHDVAERQWLLETFSPPDLAWRGSVIRQGLELLDKALAQLHRPIGELQARAEAQLEVGKEDTR